MNDNVEIIRSNKGGMKIIHRGYMYTVHKKRQGGGIRWRCTQRSLHCKGSISTGNGPPSVNMPHNHIPDPHSVALARGRQLEEFGDLSSFIETEYDEIKDSMPLQQRMLLNASSVQTPKLSELHSQSVSPMKLKVTRQANKSVVLNHTETPDLVTSDEVCLRWNSHHSNMQTKFPQLLEKEQYVDVTLMAGEHSLKCHRVILSSCSSYFEEILNDITPQQHPVIILKSIPFWILKALIDFMYAGEVNIDQNRLPELLDVAELLKVKGLAGKNANSNNAPKDDENLSRKRSVKETNVKQTNIRTTLPHIPVITKIEDTSMNDPLELLEPKLNEYNEGFINKSKEKLPPKKLFAKKLRKRKISEDEMPIFPMRRGTRSRPNVKIPKYYDYEDIVKSSSETRPFSPVITIKSEPPDVDDNDGLFSENNDNSIGVNSSANETQKQTDVDPTSSKDKSDSYYKIKIKSLCSMAKKTYSDSDNASNYDDDVNIKACNTSTDNASGSSIICNDEKAIDEEKCDLNEHNSVDPLALDQEEQK